MTSMRGRGRGGGGARGGQAGGGGDSFRRGSWRGGTPGSAGYSRGNTPSGQNRPDKSDDKAGKGFQTDTDISSSARTGERELKAWVPEAAAHNGPNGTTNGSGSKRSDDTLTFGGPISNIPWDQFETNERLFGAKTDYDEELYTTKLDRSGAGFQKREREADRLAHEIMSKTSANPHVAEERNQATPGDGKDEEEKYSGVARNPNAYVPPGARKPGSSAPPARKEKDAAKDATKDASKAESGAAPTTPAPKSNGPAVPATAPPAAAAVAPPASVPATSPSPISAPPPRSSADPIIDPAIASLGPAPPSTSMQRSTSSVPPGQANGSDAPVPLAMPPIGTVVDQARQFVESERERAAARKQSMAKNERASVLAEFKAWQTKFKVPLPMPKDILPILTKDEEKQKVIEQKAEKEMHEAKSPQQMLSPPAEPRATLSPEIKPTGAKKIPMKIPEIPPFRKKVLAAVPVPETAAQHIALVTSPTPSNASLASGTHAKLNPNASAFVFKPSAPSFKPTDSAVTSPASVAAKLPAPATPVLSSASPSKPANLFYRDGPPQRLVVNPRDDFSPFKHLKSGQSVPSASTVVPQWPYTGRRSSVAFGGPPMNMAMSPGGGGAGGGGGFDGDDPSSPHPGPPPQLMQGVPPNLLPYYRYQPGMPPHVQGGMLGPMFQPGPNFMPPQMGQSPSHMGQPPQQGPNGMPMYFPNGMPPNAHFIPPQMHFHPNGPGRPGPQGPMYYQGGGQMPQQHQTPQMQQQMSFSGQPTPPQPHFQHQLPPTQGPPQGPPQGFEGSPGPQQQ